MKPTVVTVYDQGGIRVAVVPTGHYQTRFQAVTWERGKEVAQSKEYRFFDEALAAAQDMVGGVRR